MSQYLFTSESVSEGHPDKIADQISDAVLDEILKQDPKARVACETYVKTGMALVGGEITTSAWVDIENLAREVICDIGYTSSEMGFDGRSCAVLNAIGKQSSDINQGVDRENPLDQGAGDQGIMFGYATNETEVFMPAAITYAHRLMERQAQVRKSGKLDWLRPDAKSQLTFKYEDNKIIGIDAVGAVTCSAKSGLGVEDVLEEIVAKIPAPEGDENAPLQAVIIDSWFDNYVGVVMLIRVKNGSLKLKDKVRFMSTKAESQVEQLGVFTPKSVNKQELKAGEVGFLITGVKELGQAKVGDTVTLVANPASEPLPGFKEVQSQVFAGLYPVESHDYEALRDALEKLQLNDASLKFEPEVSQALGFGFRCGFLGLLHLEIVQERLEREFDMDLITTAPTVVYEVILKSGEKIDVENPSKLPDIATIDTIMEPIITATILVPQDYVGNVMTLCNQKRGVQRNMQYMGRQVMLTYDLPMNEVVMDFFDKLKSTSRGYASLDYEFKEFMPSDLVKLDIMVNGDKVDALSLIVHRQTSVQRGRELAAKMRELIPRQMFDIAVQAAIGGQIIARENVKALRKNVLAKCYGGDITRKKKLLEKQKAGKKRMKQVGNVEIPQSAFLAILEIGEK